MTKFLGSSLIVLTTVLFLFSIVGCKPPKPPKKITPKESTSQKESIPPVETIAFTITDPTSNSEVDRNIITVSGVGAQNGTSIVVEVLTDRWYLQDGNSEIRSNGSWSYSPCYLMGKGSYRYHHSIKAKLIKDGQEIATSTVKDITAPEPTK